MTEHDDMSTDGEHRALDQGTDDDPLLVRPWIDRGGSAETWPSSAARPAPQAAAHRAIVAPIALPGRPPQQAAAPDRGHRRVRVVVVAGVAAVLALGAAGFAALRSGDDPDRSAPRALGVAAESGAPAAESSVPLASRSASPAPPAVRRPGGAGRPARTTTSGATGRTRTTNPAPGNTSASGHGALARGATQAVDRTGVIGGPGGLCLDLNSATASDGDVVQVFPCTGTDAQNWTLGADGTLRVIGRCAQSIAGANTVQIVGCDGQASAQWLAGANDSLVNVATDLCLTDPANGGASGTTVQLNACTGDANQHWKLP